MIKSTQLKRSPQLDPQTENKLNPEDFGTSMFPVVFEKVKPPYMFPLNGENAEWVSISKQLNKLLKEHLKQEGINISNPSYPKDASKDLFLE